MPQPATGAQPDTLGSIAVRRLRNQSLDDLDRFIRVQRSPSIRRLYEPYRDVWCPYTDSTLRQTLSYKNPIFEHTDVQLFVATRDGADVGRAVGLWNPLSTLAMDQGFGFFGFFEAESVEVTKVLLIDNVWPWLRERGARAIVGNNNPTTNDEAGVLVEGFHQHVMLLSFNPPEYPRFLEDLGFTSAKELLGFTAPFAGDTFASLFGNRTTVKDFRRVSRLMAKRGGISVEYIDKRNVDRFAREFCTLYNRAWRDHWGFEPLTSAELLYLSKDLVSLIPREMISIARNKDGEAVGIQVCVPDLNEVFRKFDGRLGLIEQLKTAIALFGPRWLAGNLKPKTLRVVALGVKAEYERRGASVGLMTDMVAYARTHGYETFNFSWILADNDDMLAIPRRLGIPSDQRWRMYRWPAS